MRIVIKIGTSTLAHPSGLLNIKRVEELCKIMSDLKNAGNEIILVSSGAIAMGVGKLSLHEKPHDIPTRQAAAAVGQCELMYTYDKLFSEYNFENTILRLLQLGVLPIINENDTISTDEIVIGDNDTLGAIVAKAVSADLFILLSDIDGLFTADPHKDENARLIDVVEEITPEIEKMTGGAGSKLGTGGMTTKLKAAATANAAGIDMVIANGKNPKLLYDIVDGKNVGTKFLAKKA